MQCDTFSSTHTHTHMKISLSQFTLRCEAESVAPDSQTNRLPMSLRSQSEWENWLGPQMLAQTPLHCAGPTLVARAYLTPLRSR